MADQNITALPVATSPTSSDQLLLVGATEEKLIDYDKLADAILTKLTSKQYTLDQGTKTLPAALNELNSKTPSKNVNSLENYIKNAPIGVSFCDCQNADDNPFKGNMSICMTFVNDDYSWGVQYLFVYKDIRYRTMSTGAVDEWKQIA